MDKARTLRSWRNFEAGRCSEATISGAFQKHSAILRYLSAIDPSGESYFPGSLSNVASGGIGSDIGNYIGGDNNVATQSKLKNVSAGDISVNAKCKLLHWFVDGAVAEGRIASMDPKAKTHHVPLGGSYWKVWIDRVFVEKVELIRPNEEILFLEDVI